MPSAEFLRDVNILTANNMDKNKRPRVDNLDLSATLETLQKVSIASDKLDQQEIAISPAILSLIALVENLAGYSAKGKNYSTLCNESSKFSTLQYALQLASWAVNLKNLERKKAISDCPRPVKDPKKSAQKPIEAMSDDEICRYLTSREGIVSVEIKSSGNPADSE